MGRPEYKQISDLAKQFVNGTPVEKEIEFLDGDMIFHFDNPAEKDVEQRQVVASLFVNRDADFTEFDPEPGDDLEKDPMLPNNDLIKNNPKLERELHIIKKLLQGRFAGVTGPDYDEANSDSSFAVFVYTLHMD